VNISQLKLRSEKFHDDDDGDDDDDDDDDYYLNCPFDTRAKTETVMYVFFAVANDQGNTPVTIISRNSKAVTSFKNESIIFW